MQILMASGRWCHMRSPSGPSYISNVVIHNEESYTTMDCLFSPFIFEALVMTDYAQRETSDALAEVLY